MNPKIKNIEHEFEQVRIHFTDGTEIVAKEAEFVQILRNFMKDEDENERKN